MAPLFLNPAMSPIHLAVWASAFCFQVVNACCIGGYLAGYGPRTLYDWAGTAPRIEIGIVIFLAGLAGNVYHDDELREIRRAAARDQKKKTAIQEEKAKHAKVDKVYRIPENGLFRVVLYPHYFCEWIEWCGFWIIGGLGCVPARIFLTNEVATMLPRALSGRRWYVQKFGEEKIAGRRAVIPGVI